MGWWDVPGAPGTTIGDEGLDETHRFLRRLGGLYESGLGRKPTLEELRATLELSLRVNADARLLADFEEREVASLAIKAAKRPKRQAYRAGDVFAIPLAGDRFAFGRIMEQSKRGTLVEIFRATSDGMKYSPDVVASGRLFHPIYVSGTELFEGYQWRVVSSDPAYAPTDLQTLRFVVGAPGDLTLSEGGRQRPIGDAEAAGIEHKSFWRHDATVRRITEALAGGGSPA